ncbi:MAG: site-2 protease family protein, partial [Candidatus Eisenbacteria bacterium]|nr:site-2 protease family protein [Candidatus Eisenbacteria bacterium]
MIHLALLVLTFLTTTFGGSLNQGGNPLRDPSDMALGLSYSIPLLTILLGHELGHYFACRRHRLGVTLPYFIPVLPPVFLFGTLGAFIKIRTPIQDRRALLDVGVAGPLTGMVLAIPLAAIGIAMSTFVPAAQAEGALMLGDSLLFVFLVHLVKGSTPAGMELMLHPVAFAGWIGFLVTAL